MISVIIDVPNKRQTIEVPLKFPVDAIPGTKVCSVSISGTVKFIPPKYLSKYQASTV
jgi:hypothetical protein